MTDPINHHFEKLAKLLAYEEAEEILQFQQEFLLKTPEEREKNGRALLGLDLTEAHYSPAGHRLFTFQYPNAQPFPVYSPDIGDVVVISQNPTDLEGMPSGTVYEKEKDRITVAVSYKIPDWLDEPRGVFHLSAASNRSTYKKMREAMEVVRIAKHDRPAFFRDLVLGIKKPESFDPVKPGEIVFVNPNLNQWQQEAVGMALAVKDIGLLHGPPGTGKTTVLVEIIRQSVGQGKFVFATAPSNTACDHILECLIKAGVPALRLGHPARIMDHLREHTLDFRLAAHPHAKMVEEMEFAIEKIQRKRERHRDRRELGWDERRNMADELQQLKTDIRLLENEIFTQVFHQAPVMVGTLTSAADPFLKRKSFDLLVIDEATQAVEPSCWIPVIKAAKVILAGDHFQLPPTVRSKAAEDGGLGVTLFERFYKYLGAEWKTLLKVQYRMNEKIMNFSSKKFYKGALIADESVKNHTLAELPGVKRLPGTEEVFLFIDTAGRGFEEEMEPGSESRFNSEEAKLVVEQLKHLLDAGVPPDQIAIISPYSAQVRLLSRLCPQPGLEVDSVDGFQGREKEAVIISLVRSNYEGEMGFLTDTRRMNVAMTRARRKLVVIGDSATISNIGFYQDFIKYAESIGAYRSSWEMLE